MTIRPLAWLLMLALIGSAAPRLPNRGATVDLVGDRHGALAPVCPAGRLVHSSLPRGPGRLHWISR